MEMQQQGLQKLCADPGQTAQNASDGVQGEELSICLRNKPVFQVCCSEAGDVQKPGIRGTRQPGFPGINVLFLQEH